LLFHDALLSSHLSLSFRVIFFRLFSPSTLARTSDSLVRVSRRVDSAPFTPMHLEHTTHSGAAQSPATTNNAAFEDAVLVHQAMLPLKETLPTHEKHHPKAKVASRERSFQAVENAETRERISSCVLQFPQSGRRTPFRTHGRHKKSCTVSFVAFATNDKRQTKSLLDKSHGC